MTSATETNTKFNETSTENETSPFASTMESMITTVVASATADPGPNIGGIVGGVVGALIGIGVMIAVVIFVMKKRAREKNDVETPKKQRPLDMPRPEVAPTLKDATENYDKVSPTVANQHGSYYNNDYTQRRSHVPTEIEERPDDDDDDPDAIYVNDPATYVNFSSSPRRPRGPSHLNLRGSNHLDDTQEQYYGNVPNNPSRTPSARRDQHADEEEDEYLPMDNYRGY